MAQRAAAVVVLDAELVAVLFQLLDKEDRDGIVALSNCLNSLRICYQQLGIVHWICFVYLFETPVDIVISFNFERNEAGIKCHRIGAVDR